MLPSTFMPLRMLLISHDFGLVNDLCDIAQHFKIFCEICSDGQSALKRLCKSKFECILIDYKDQPEALRIITGVHNSTSHRMAVTFAVTDLEQKGDAISAGFHFVLTRPLDLKQVQRTMRIAFPMLVQERRRYFRASVAVPVTVESRSCGRVSATSLNVSEGGMALECTVSLPVGAKATLQFRLPRMMMMELEAEVCWTKDKMAGLQFQRVPAELSDAVKSWLTQQMQEAIPELAGA